MAEQTKEYRDIANRRLPDKDKADSVSLSLNECKQKCLDTFNHIIYFKEYGVEEKDILPDKSDLSKIILAFHERDTRMELVDRFKSIGSPRQVINIEGLKILGDLLRYLLTAIIHEKDVNFKVLYAILNVSQLLYAKDYKMVEDKHGKKDY